MMKSALEEVEKSLVSARKRWGRKRITYYVPSCWTGEGGRTRRTKADPFELYLDRVRWARRLKAVRQRKSSGGEWTRNAVIYNMFVRTTAAFDHDGNGQLDLPLNGNGFRETGTFLKAIAMLSYVKSLGANTIHLLPITTIGHDGNKGSLGSPYAIKNAYEIDENLSEPCLGLDAKTEFKAFVEAAHRVGFRVVAEFVFRTAAKDADWVREHPEWFYWIREEVAERNQGEEDETRYGSPLFTKEELDAIHHDVSEHRLDQLIPPHDVYRNLFTEPPEAGRVEKRNGRYVGILSAGTRVKIPGAFADWPPDDNQPPWGDVTYLRMYDHADFNYIGYNTIRMYDTRLARPECENRPLWDKIIGIVPYYQHEYHIDGVMIDMGHALPVGLKKEIIVKARSVDPDFAFWDENFSINRKSREEGYNAVFGFLWIDEHHPARMRSFFRRCSSEGIPVPYFATPENHNTPRAASRPGGMDYAKWAWVINCFLPAVPFLHSGFELGETYPINTGLDFTPEQLKQLPSHRLPLFSEYGYDWFRKGQIVDLVTAVSAIRKRYADLVVNSNPESFVILHDVNEKILAFARVSSSPRRRVAVVTNSNFRSPEEVSITLETRTRKITDLLTRKKMSLNHGRFTTRLKPGQCLVFEY